MEGNDLSTDNLALSDELSAPSVYSDGKETSYAKSKRVKGAAITLTSLLVVAGGALDQPIPQGAAGDQGPFVFLFGGDASGEFRLRE